MGSKALVTLARGLPHLQSLTYESEKWTRARPTADSSHLHMRLSMFEDFAMHAHALTALRLRGHTPDSLHLPEGWGSTLATHCPALTDLEVNTYDVMCRVLVVPEGVGVCSCEQLSYTYRIGGKRMRCDVLLRFVDAWFLM
jgi:hypothetical protein